MAMWTRRTPWVLLLGDLIALALFVFIGQQDHGLVDEVNPLWGVLQSGWVFFVVWAAAGLWLGAFSEHIADPAGRVWGFLSRSLNAWLVAALLGLLLRSVVLGRAVVPTVFIVATLGFGGLFVLGWRLLFVLGWTLGRRRSAAR